jgi:hypothetical protein
MKILAFRWLNWRRDFCIALVLSVLAAMAWLCWKSARDPAIPLLPPGSADWILYPSPAHAEINSESPVPADFVRQLELAAVPARAEISWRAFRRSEISINGVALPMSGAPGGNWKNVSRADAASYFRPGTNTITATVWNSNGPPALSVRVEIDGAVVKSDENWSVSLAGCAWRQAALASAATKFGAGSELQGLEETGPALRECWPWLFFLLSISVFLAVGLKFGLAAGGSRPRRLLALGVGAIWVLLFAHNARLLPLKIGFDSSAHLDYIDYIQDHKSLPSPKEGWEMFQGPLYYAVSAGLLWVGHLRTSQWAGMMLLRCLSVVIGAANIALIYASLRLIFPGEWKKQMAGAVLAAFLPAQICLLHYTTNETLSAALMSGAFYLCLRILRAPPPATGLHAGLGCVLGLALLAKVSALVFLPVIFAVLAGRLIVEQQRAARQWLRTIGLAGFCVLLVAGWRYVQVWRDFGNPLVGNWDARVAAPWWQEPGYHTAGYFFTFGRSLTAPLFSGFDSFWDCFYTTLWGDSLGGGAAATQSLPPWNYSLMDAGFLLALLPSALVLTGLAGAVWRCLRAPDLTFLLLLGTAGSAGFAVVYMTLKLAFYSQGKCFYGLPALLPLCVFGIMGLDFCARLGRSARIVLEMALLLWLCNVYASFWILPNSLKLQAYTALSLSSEATNGPAARRAVDQLLRADPANETGLILRCQEVDAAAGIELLRKALSTNPRNGEFAKFLASRLSDAGQTNEALALAQRAFALEPENLQAANQLCSLATQMGRNDVALEAGRAALAMDPTDPTLQFNVGCAWANLRYPSEAVRQFRMLLDLKPLAETEARTS